MPLVLAISTPAQAEGTRAEPPSCEQSAPQVLAGSPSRSAARAGAKKSAITLTPANDNSKVIERNFGEDRGVYKRTLAFISDRPLSVDPKRVSVSIAGGLVDPKTTEVFPVERTQVRFGVETNPTTPSTLTVSICIDPSHPQAVPPGQYVGTLLIAGRGIVPAQIPVTLTLKSAKVLLAWLMGLIGLVLGLGVKLLSDRVNRPAKSQQQANPQAAPPQANQQQADQQEGGPNYVRLLSMVVVGVVLTVGVVIKLYYEPATFGDSFSNFWPIILGSATATAGGTTVVDLFKGT